MATEATHGVSRAGKYNLKKFGAKGDGVTDDTSAISDWLDAITDDNAIGYVPAGTYLMNSKITKDFGLVNWGIAGDVRGGSKFLVPATNTSGAFDLFTSDRGSQATFKDFSVQTQGQGGIGFRYDSVEGGDQHLICLTAENIRISGEDISADYFDTFASFRGLFRPKLNNVVVSGPWSGLDWSTGSTKFAADVAINLDGSYDASVEDCYAWGAYRLITSRQFQGTITAIASDGSGGSRITLDIGDYRKHPFSTGNSITIEGAGSPYDGTWTVKANVSATQFDIPVVFTTNPATGTAHAIESAEAFRMSNSIMVHGRIGFDFIRYSGREPIIWLNNNHCSCRDEGFKIDGARLVTGSGNVIYNVDTTPYYGGTPYDVNFVNASEILWKGNFHHYAGNPARIFAKVNYTASGEGANVSITDNMFTGDANYGVWLTSGASNAEVVRNKFTGTIGTGYVYDPSLNNLVQTDANGQVVGGTWTPVLAFGGASTGITYTTQTGRYRMSDGVAYVEIEILLTSKGSATGAATITLPANMNGGFSFSANKGSLSPTFANNLASITGEVRGRPVSATSMALTQMGSASLAALTDANFTNTSRIILTGILEVS